MGRTVGCPCGASYDSDWYCAACGRSMGKLVACVTCGAFVDPPQGRCSHLIDQLSGAGRAKATPTKLAPTQPPRAADLAASLPSTAHVTARPGETTTCSFCREPLGHDALLECVRCGHRLHAACAREMSPPQCPTLSCPGPLQGC